jgi:FAD dependent oxidoreductase
VAGNVIWEWPPIPDSCGYNQLPYRMLLPRRAVGRVANLLVAGRCASMTHDGQSAARVSGACFVMGEAAGTAAALAMADGVSLYHLDTEKLRSALSAQGVFLG